MSEVLFVVVTRFLCFVVVRFSCNVHRASLDRSDSQRARGAEGRRATIPFPYSVYSFATHLFVSLYFFSASSCSDTSRTSECVSVDTETISKPCSRRSRAWSPVAHCHISRQPLVHRHRR